MSFFRLFNTDLERQLIHRFSDVVSAHGLAKRKRISLDRKELVLYGDQTGSDLAFHQADNGDFIAVLGSLLFDGEATPICLPALLGNFDPDTFSWKGLLGTHVILIYKMAG